MLVRPGGVHGAAQQPSGERGGGDLVGDQADHGRTAAAQAAGDGVGPVAELGGGLPDAFLGGGREVAAARPLKTKDTAVCDTPASRATSREVGRPDRVTGFSSALPMPSAAFIPHPSG